MPYCLVKNFMITYVRNDQLLCAKVKVKLSGGDSAAIYNYMYGTIADNLTHILLEKEADLNVLPIPEYRKRAKLLDGQGSVFKRLEQQAKVYGITCRVIDLFKDSVMPIAYLFFLNQTGHVACSVLETDKAELSGKTIFVGTSDVATYAGANVLPVTVDTNFDVDDSSLGDNIYALHDADTKMLVTVCK